MLLWEQHLAAKVDNRKNTTETYILFIEEKTIAGDASRKAVQLFLFRFGVESMDTLTCFIEAQTSEQRQVFKSSVDGV